MASSILAPSPLNDFELQRLQRIAENRRRMEESGLLETAKNLMQSMKPAISKPPIRHTPKERRRKTRHQPVRRSGRLSGQPAEYGEVDCEESGTLTYSDSEPGLKDLLAGDAEIENLSQEKQVQFQEMRCSSAAGRGSMYDSVVGITCHFCRQKKLCGEEGCPRCSRRSTTAECIGKTDCSRCHSATGRFCRACLLIRYGQKLEDVREEMAADTWLCPHCYEEEHPEEGWMCNSSICMKRRGFKPTGIAIYDAQQRGFPSVAHWLQAQLLKEDNNKSSSKAGAASATAAAAAAGNKAAATSSSQGSNASCSAAGAAAADGEGEVETAAAAVAGAGKKKDNNSKGAAAGGGKKNQKKGAAGVVVMGSQESHLANGADDDATAAAAAAAVAPPSTPSKSCEGTPGPNGAAAAGGAAGGGSGRRATRSTAAAAVGGGVVAAAVAEGSEPACKRACVGAGAAAARRSLRFRR